MLGLFLSGTRNGVNEGGTIQGVLCSVLNTMHQKGSAQCLILAVEVTEEEKKPQNSKVTTVGRTL